MGKVGAETCGVCQEKPSKYRCPGCKAPYCSLACNKLHKSGTGGNSPCTGKRPLSAQEATQGTGEASPAKRSRVGSEGENNAGGDAAVEEVEAAVCARTGRDQWRGGREDREEEEWQMSADQRDRMSGCKWLKAALRDPKLQGLLVSCFVVVAIEKGPRGIRCGVMPPYDSFSVYINLSMQYFCGRRRPTY